MINNVDIKNTRYLSKGSWISLGFISYICLFVLLYLEDRIFLFGLSLSNIWKISLVFLALAFIGLKIKAKVPNLYAYAIIFIICIGLNGSLTLSINDIERMMLFLVLPVSYYSFYFISQSNIKRLKNILLFLSLFVLTSTIPFILGFIEPITDEGLDSFAISYNLDTSMLVGFFKHPAISSKVFVISTIVIFSLGLLNSKKSSIENIFWLFILLFGFYCIYLSFTRTGWLMIAAFFGIFILKTNDISAIKKIGLLFIGFSLLIIFFTQNDAFANRLLGVRNGVEVSSNFLNTISSGRTEIFITLIGLIFSGSMLNIILGMGSEMFSLLNYGGAAHNVFIETFIVSGLLGLFVYIFWLILLYKEIIKYSIKSNISAVVSSVYWCMIVSFMLSHGLGFFGNILFGGLIAYHRLEGQKNIIKQ